MRKRYLLLALMPLLAAGAFAAGMVPVAWNPLLPDPDEQVEGRASRTAKAPASDGRNVSGTAAGAAANGRVTRAAAARAPAGRDAPAGGGARRFGIDIARIDPNGGSVIAGYAEPNARITVLADGRPIGNATADAAGDWMLVTSHRFGNDDPQLTVVADDGRTRVASATTDTTRPDQRRTPAEMRASMAADAAAAQPETGEVRSGPDRRTAADVTRQMLDRIRTLTREAEAARARPGGAPVGADAGGEARAGGGGSARANADELAQARLEAAPVALLNTPNAPAQAPSLAVAAIAPKPGLEPARAAAVAAAAPVARADGAAPPMANLPVPVQFVYRQSEFTEQGREAARALLDYVKVKRFAAVTLSGHADERGTPPANLDLSAKRLERIERFLRDGGYRGTLTLVPKGESEDYTGVDRSRFSIEDLYQLDRRVEVVAAK